MKNSSFNKIISLCSTLSHKPSHKSDICANKWKGWRKIVQLYFYYFCSLYVAQESLLALTDMQAFQGVFTDEDFFLSRKSLYIPLEKVEKVSVSIIIIITHLHELLYNPLVKTPLNLYGVIYRTWIQ